MSHKQSHTESTDYTKQTSNSRRPPASFTALNKKTPFQRHKEETEFKKKKETEEAAKIYEDFVASFETQNYAHGTSGFVRSSTDQAKFSSSASGVPSSSKSGYKPMAFVKANESKVALDVPSNEHPNVKRPHREEKPINTSGDHDSNKRKKSNSDNNNVHRAEDDDDDDDDDDVLAQMKQAKAVKKRHMDAFLEEIKKGQENRTKGHESSSSKSAYDDSFNSHENSDPYTTNLFLADLHPSVNEDILCAEFGKYGPIASVKVMWPRTEEEVERQRNCGFVSFMTRKDAAAALEGMNGKEVHGRIMKVGWGKPVSLPANPVYVLQKRQEKREQVKLPFNAKMVDGELDEKRTELTVIPPTDIETIKIIHRLVERVVKCGPLFEELIMQKEANNPQFLFLFNNSHPDHVYYRWRLYSILQGDTVYNWRTDPFQMFEGGEWWIPPDVPDVPFDEDGTLESSFNSEDEANERKKQRLPKGQLGKIGRRRYEAILRQVTYQRGTIARAMAFAIEHADAYEDIIEITYKSIIGPNATITSKIARLFLVSDILHNSSVHVTNAWRYRDGFQKRLPDIFEHLNGIYRSITARLKAEQFRRYITITLGAWENWMVFPKHFIEKLDAIFMKKSNEHVEKGTQESIDLPDTATKDTNVFDQPIRHDTNTNSLADDLNEDDVDGVALDEIDGEALDDIDGEEL